MNTLLFSVIAAASLVAVGAGATGETRSAQSLPRDHLFVASQQAVSTGKLHHVNRLSGAAADNLAADQSGLGPCQRDGGHWDAINAVCHGRIAWPVPAIGAGTTAGVITALTSGDNPIGATPVSH